MAIDTLIGTTGAPPGDPTATAITVDESSALTRTPTTVRLLTRYWPVGVSFFGFRYTLEGFASGDSVAGGIITVPDAEASALIAAGAAMSA